MYFAIFLIMTAVMVWTVPWLMREFVKEKEAARFSFGPTIVATATMGVGLLFIALACFAFLVTRMVVPAQLERGLVDALLLNLNPRQDVAMLCAYATFASGLVLWVKAAFAKHT